MTRPLYHYPSYILRIFAILILLMFSAMSQAYSADQNEPSIRLSAAYHPRFVRTEVAYESKALWQSSFFDRPIEMRFESSLAYWHANHHVDEAKSHHSLWQVGLTPMLRWWWTDHWYLEAGIGPTLMSHTRFLNKDFSTALQFGDHLGLGVMLNHDWRLGIRFSHFSNASIKKPNPGFNMLHFSVNKSF